MDSKKYLADWYDAIGFLEQQNGGAILNGVPIPMLQTDIVDEIKNPGKEGTLDVDHIFTAMCVVIGLDEHFPYASDYIAFLKENLEDTLRALEGKILSAAQSDDAERVYLFAHAKEILRGSIEDRLDTTYAMEGIYNLRWYEDEGKSSEDLLKEIMDRYEEILEEDPDNPHALMALGRVHEAREHWIKAKFYYEKALQSSDDDGIKEELRRAIETVTEPAAIDGAKTYLHYGRYEDALKSLDEVSSQYTDPGKCTYIKGMAYYGLGDYERAVDYLEEASRHTKAGDVLNDYAIALAALGREEDAIGVLTETIENNEEDRTAYMNRGILYYRSEAFSEALCDFEAAYHLASDSQLWELIEQTRKLTNEE